MHLNPHRTLMHSQQNAGAFLDQAEDIGPLMPKVRHLLRLRRAVVQLLPESLSGSCSVANARQGKLVLFAQSSVVAAKLKLLAPTLRDRLLEVGEQVTSVVIEVQPPDVRECAKLNASVLTPGAAAALEELSHRIAESPLRSVLRALASRAKT